MKIETKYNIGDKVWVNHYGEPKEIELTDIHIHLNGIGAIVYYQNRRLYEGTFPENAVYATKEEVLKLL